MINKTGGQVVTVIILLQRNCFTGDHQGGRRHPDCTTEQAGGEFRELPGVLQVCILNGDITAKDFMKFYF